MGAFGFSTWIDVTRQIAGVFMVFNQLGNVFDGVQNLQATVRTVVDSTPCHHPPSLSIQSAGAATNLVTLHGARGRSYALESSATLTVWTNLFDLPDTKGLWQIPLPKTTGPGQFIRTKRLP